MLNYKHINKLICFFTLLLICTSHITFASKNLQKRLQIECDNNDMASCSSLGLMYEKDIDIKQDYEKAIALYGLACGNIYMDDCQKNLDH